MAKNKNKRSNNNLQNITQKIKDRARPTPLNSGANSGAPEGNQFLLQMWHLLTYFNFVLKGLISTVVVDIEYLICMEITGTIYRLITHLICIENEKKKLKFLIRSWQSSWICLVNVYRVPSIIFDDHEWLLKSCFYGASYLGFLSGTKNNNSGTIVSFLHDFVQTFQLFLRSSCLYIFPVGSYNCVTLISSVVGIFLIFDVWWTTTLVVENH